MIGIAIPVVNLIYVFARMWSRPPLPPGNYGYCGTPGVVALFLMFIGAPTLGLLLAGVGAAVGAFIDKYRAAPLAACPEAHSDAEIIDRT